MAVMILQLLTVAVQVLAGIGRQLSLLLSPVTSLLTLL